MVKPKLNIFKLLFQFGKSFSITEEQYIKESGLNFSQAGVLANIFGFGANGKNVQL